MGVLRLTPIRYFCFKRNRMTLKRFSVWLALTFLAVSAGAQQVLVLLPRGQKAPEGETLYLTEWLKSLPTVEYTTAGFGELPTVLQNNPPDVIWYHHSDTIATDHAREELGYLLDWIEEGGILIGTLEGARLIGLLQPGSRTFEVRHRRVEDQGYGRKQGIHAFRNHPLFDKMNGGAYLFDPPVDTTVRIIGLFEGEYPVNGKTIATDWAYIFLHEEEKPALTYQQGKGQMVAIGAYCVLDESNKKRHDVLKLFENLLDWVTGKKSGIPELYWEYGPQSVTITPTPKISQEVSFDLQLPDASDTLYRAMATTEYWDLPGERIFLSGTENGGIDEVWVHPFMVLNRVVSAYRTGNMVFSPESIPPEVVKSPLWFRRIYKMNGGTLTETFLAAREQATAAVVWEWNGSDTLEVAVNLNGYLRLMWPYSEKVIRHTEVTKEAGFGGFSFSAPDDSLFGIIGTARPGTKLWLATPDRVGDTTGWANGILTFQGFHPDTAASWAGSIVQMIAPGDNAGLVVSVSMKSFEEAEKQLTDISGNKIMIDPGFDPAEKYLMLRTPDTTFNKGYRWALRNADNFIVNTPGIGRSLVAGYGTTRRGWDGGHRINGRPGYAWYFGRDGVWSGFALLQYGNFEAVRDMLSFFITYQNDEGKIFHELTTSGAVHYDAADATPLFIILAGEYLRYSGDTAFIKKNLEAIRKAVNFCYSTDTDGDHLIENTGVGHGWVEGGPLFGTHTSLYLAACQAQALNSTAMLASCPGVEDTSLSRQWQKDAQRVVSIINDSFWDPEKNHYMQGFRADGSWIGMSSVLQAVPAGFGQLPEGRARRIVSSLSGSAFSADWGCRILADTLAQYNPRSYHGGSVWPLFTGWASLAAYKTGMPLQGFNWLSANLKGFRYGALGSLEEVLNGEIFSPSGVCAHQCWSQTMVLQPALQGLLGIEPDALKNQITLKPQLPANWNSFSARRIRTGNHTVNLVMNRQVGFEIWKVTHQGDDTLSLTLYPSLMTGSEIISVSVDGVLQKNTPDCCNLIIRPGDSREVRFTVSPGVELAPVNPRFSPGEKSNDVRLIETYWDDPVYTFSVEGSGGSKGELMLISDRIPEKIDGAGWKPAGNNRYRFNIEFLGVTGQRQIKKVSVTLHHDAEE
ncbi:MAG: hypothetical protein Kow00127_17250 [Bacteroidales bacterium]